MIKSLRKASIACLMLATVLFVPFYGEAASLPNFVELAEDAGAAVVNINTERNVKGGSHSMFPGEMFRNLPPEFEWFLDQFEKQGKQQSPSRMQRSLGTGFIISADGYIVTNNHVVKDADKVMVSFESDKGKESQLEATIIGTDEETDLALLKVETKESLPFLTFGNSDSMKVGEWLLAIGNPFGLGHTVTAGILSAKGRDIQVGPFDNFLQTDASINPGNSGGPLLNMSGEVIGINTAIIASGQGIGFAIPSTMASTIIEQLKTGKKVRRGWIGVTIQGLDENTAKALGLKNTEGALIGSVMDDEPADKAGILAGDVVIRINGKSVEDASALLRAIAAEAPGSKVRVVVMRDGKPKNMTVILGERNLGKAGFQGSSATPQEGPASLGLSIRSISAEEARNAQVDGGLFITSVEDGSIAAEAQLRKGDILLSANLRALRTPAELSRIVTGEAQKRGAVMLQVVRRGQTFFVTLPLADKAAKDSKKK